MAARTSLTVCVFGGTGFVGRALLARLSAAGYAVRVPTRSRARHRALLVLPRVELIETDIHDERNLDSLLTGAHAAVNLVGILNEKGRDGSGFHQVHVALVEKILRACHRQAVPRLLHMSELKANERGPSHYLRTKGEGERALKSAAGTELRYTIFQPSVIFGPGDSFLNRFSRLARVLPLFPLARGDARFAPVFVEDVAEAFVRALTAEAPGGRTYQLCGPESFSLREIVELIIGTLEIKRVVIGLPDSLARLQAWLMELVPGKPFSLDNYRSLTVASTCTKDGLAALGVTPRSLRTALPGLEAYSHPQRALSRFRQRSGR